MKRTSVAFLIFLLSLMLTACSGRKNRAIFTSSPPVENSTPFGFGTSSLHCTVGAIPRFVQWRTFTPPNTQREDLYPVFRFDVRVNQENTKVASAMSLPNGYAFAGLSNHLNVILLPSSRDYAVAFLVRDEATGSETDCKSPEINYNQLLTQAGQAPWDRFSKGLVPSFVPADFFLPWEFNAKPSGPYQLRIVGPSSIPTLECTHYDVEVLDKNNNPIAAGSELTVEVSDDGEGNRIGAIYEDANCKSPLRGGELKYSKNDRRKPFWYIASQPGMYKVKAEPKDSKIKPAEKDITVESNGKFQNNVCINFEDWTDYDYNDVTLSIQGKVVYNPSIRQFRFFEDQRISVKVNNSIAACKHRVKFQIETRDSHTGVWKPAPGKGFVVEDSTNPGAGHDFDVTINDRAVVTFRTLPESASMCSETAGKDIGVSNSNRVRITNKCYGEEVENQDVRGDRLSLDELLKDEVLTQDDNQF